MCDFSINWILSIWQMSEILLGQFCIFLTNERWEWFALSTFAPSQYGFVRHLISVLISDCHINIPRGRHFSWVVGSSDKVFQEVELFWRLVLGLFFWGVWVYEEQSSLFIKLCCIKLKGEAKQFLPCSMKKSRGRSSSNWPVLLDVLSGRSCRLPHFSVL